MTTPGTPVQIDNPDKQDSQHPAIAGVLLQTSRLNRGPVAEVDYDLEPFSKLKGAKGKPQDDLSAYLDTQRAKASRVNRGIF